MLGKSYQGALVEQIIQFMVRTIVAAKYDLLDQECNLIHMKEAIKDEMKRVFFLDILNK